MSTLRPDEAIKIFIFFMVGGMLLTTICTHLWVAEGNPDPANTLPQQMPTYESNYTYEPTNNTAPAPENYTVEQDNSTTVT